MPMNIFPILILNARPAAGKSEIIDYVQNTPLAERQERFHIGNLDVIDDFPMLWAWFEEDAMLSDMGHPRLHTTAEGYFKYRYLWHVLIRRISLAYHKRRRDILHYETYTTLIEFSRGSEHGGYAEAYQHLSPNILKRAGVLYIRVSFEASLAKNRARRNPERPDSILEHSLDDEKMYRLYHEDDWDKFSAGHPEYLNVQGCQVPYTVFENEDDVTTPRGPALGERLEDTLKQLWQRYQNKEK